MTDALTQHMSLAIIKSEKSDDILEGLIKTVLPFKISSLKTKIKVDTARGLSSLIKNPKKLLNQDIIVEFGRSKNMNRVP